MTCSITSYVGDVYPRARGGGAFRVLGASWRSAVHAAVVGQRSYLLISQDHEITAICLDEPTTPCIMQATRFVVGFVYARFGLVAAVWIGGGWAGDA